MLANGVQTVKCIEKRWSLRMWINDTEPVHQMEGVGWEGDRTPGERERGVFEKRGVLRALPETLWEPVRTPELVADGTRDPPPPPPTPSAEKSEFDGARDPIEEVTFENQPATAAGRGQNTRRRVRKCSETQIELKWQRLVNTIYEYECV